MTKEENIMMDAKVKRLENQIKQACLIDKPRMVRHGVNDPTNELDDYHRELINLLPWLGPHITKCSNQGNALDTVERAAPTVAREIEDFPQIILEGKMKPHTSDVTT